MPWWQTRMYTEGLNAEFSSRDADGPVDGDNEDDGWMPLGDMGGNIEHATFG